MEINNNIKKQMEAVTKALKEKHSHNYVITYNLEGDDMSRPRKLLTRGFDSGEVEKNFNSTLGWQRSKVNRLSIHRQNYEEKWW